jgi:hypothetical protein
VPKVKHPTSGAILGVKPERAKRLVERGYKLIEGELPDEGQESPAVEQEAQEAPAAPGPEDQGNQTAAVERPSSWARKGSWVLYAESIGVDVSESMSMSKADIIAAVEAHEAG